MESKSSNKVHQTWVWVPPFSQALYFILGILVTGSRKSFASSWEKLFFLLFNYSAWPCLAVQRSAKRRGCLLSYSQAEPGRELTQPSPCLLAEPCIYIGTARCSNSLCKILRRKYERRGAMPTADSADAQLTRGRLADEKWGGRMAFLLPTTSSRYPTTANNSLDKEQSPAV